MPLPAQQIQLVQNIQIEHSINQISDEKALTRYFELLKKYPKLKRPDELNDYIKGVYQVIYDRAEILAIRLEIYNKLYADAKSKGLNDIEADELAADYSRPGVVCEDKFWLWIRDVVISPQGYKHTYNRIVWKTDLERVGGAAALPIVEEKDGSKKVIVELVFRHATNSWEIELPRGMSKANETSADTAKREILEETGVETDNLVLLGTIAPDSGVIASVIPIFVGTVTVEKDAKHDKTEAIKGKFAFTAQELLEGFKRGYMEIMINGTITRAPMRDPFLSYALLMAQSNGLL